MKIILLVCACTSAHNFTNFGSYNGLVDYSYVCDTGLKECEKRMIKKALPKTTFFEYEFENNFSAMRNYAIEKVDKWHPNSWIIHPDDSWSILNFSRSYLQQAEDKGYSTVVCKVTDNKSEYFTKKIFKSHHRFFGRVRETLKCKKKSVLCPIEFRDCCLDEQRSYSPSRFPQDPYLQAIWYRFHGNTERSIRLFETVIQDKRRGREQRYLAMIQLSAILKKPELLREASQFFPERAKEALYYLYKITKDEKILDEIRNETWGQYYLQFPLGLRQKIDDLSNAPSGHGS